jgi:hypothetical protein
MLQELALSCQKSFGRFAADGLGHGASVEWLELPVASCRADVILAGTQQCFR